LALSPFLNPIEEIFGYIKHKFRIINRSEIYPERIFDNIDLVIKSVSREKIVKFVAHSISFAIKGLKKEPIF
jgi:hypothetical protein